MSTGHVLLGFLASGPSHGYDLKRRHDARFPQARPLAYGQVYATLGRLARDGQVTAGPAEAGEGPERTTYTLTAGGRDELRGWLSTVIAPAPHVASEMLGKVVTALLTAKVLYDGPEDPAADYLTAQRAAHMKRMRELTALKTDPASSLADVLAADYALAHLDADLRWMDSARNRLADLAATLD
jgi:DNA-binding PadR family transcriptional regulator